ncbi:actin-like protein arp8 [Geranomyces variabilis]|uniref:Actin-like protein arp8 n=1 Tax=Geranomyces variabilis TaxID=109894 RepID=A0AAD5TM70_9FUNG|nr:actin-like protein arp8 [Geranomyces variabilis]
MTVPNTDHGPFKFSSIPAVTAYPTNPKNIQATFLKNPNQTTNTRDAVQIDPNQAFDDVLVIHAGSRFLRIGRAAEALPKEVPHLIVRKMYDPDDGATASTEAPASLDAIADEPELVKVIQDDIRLRMREQKIRSIPNAHAQVLGYNEQVVAESIPDHNDPYKIEWHRLEGQDHVVGSKALRVCDIAKTHRDPSDGRMHRYRAFYPIQHGLLNTRDYISARACLADMQVIWTESIETELGIPRAQFSSFNVVCIIPDVNSKLHVRETLTMLLQGMKFRGATLLQESVAATFGAGITTACVIDVGAQKTSIACVEDGMCALSTRLNLKYGGDDVTAFLMKVLSKSAFPYKEYDAKTNAHDWSLADELKEKFCTYNESEMQVNLCDFYVRAPDRPTSVYRMKVYDEVLQAPRALFFPQVINFGEKLKHIMLNETYLDFDAEEEGNGEELPADALVANITAYQTYILNPQKYFNGLPKPDTPPPTAENAEVEATDVVGSESEDSDATPGPRRKRLRVDSRGGSSAELAAVELISPTHEIIAKSEIGGELEPPLPEPPLSHFLRRRRAIGTLPDISLPLHVAVARCLTLYANAYPEGKEAELESHIKKLCGSILVVGGGALTSGFNRQLETRLAAVLAASPLKKRLDALSVTGSTQALSPRVLQNPRDIDSTVLAWKGGAVFGKLDMTGDLWIGRAAWEAGGIAGNLHRLMFPWD